MNPWEEENLRAYKLLLRIEVVLRECLRISLQSEFGVQWQKKIPGEVLKKVKEAQSEENQPQFNFRRLGPLYYLSLGELLPILQQKPGRPGVTGWAQICFHYAGSLEDSQIKLQYDLYHVKNLSLWLDLRILCRTMGVLWRGEGAR